MHQFVPHQPDGPDPRRDSWRWAAGRPGVATFVLNWLLKKANLEADIEGTEGKAD